MQLYYDHVGVKGSREHFPLTLSNKKPISVIEKHVPDSYPHKVAMLRHLRTVFPSGFFNCWGLPTGAVDVVKKLEIGDVVLLVETIGKDGAVPALCEVVGFWRDELKDLSKALWGESKFAYIFFFNTEPISLTWDDLSRDLNFKPNFNPSGLFYRVTEPRLDPHGGVERYVAYLRTNYAKSTEPLDSISIEDVKEEVVNADAKYHKSVKKEVVTIKNKSLDKKPRLTEGLSKKTKKVSERPRSAAFRVSIKKLYQWKCAICGVSLKSPSGSHAVESAHIYPKELDGSDDLRNGICLCPQHHWAFDAGWLSIADDYTVLIHAELPTNGDYDFIRTYASKEINLPQQIEFAPHQLFLQAHRKLKKFE